MNPAEVGRWRAVEGVLRGLGCGHDIGLQAQKKRSKNPPAPQKALNRHGRKVEHTMRRVRGIAERGEMRERLPKMMSKSLYGAMFNGASAVANASAELIRAPAGTART